MLRLLDLPTLVWTVKCKLVAPVRASMNSRRSPGGRQASARTAVVGGPDSPARIKVSFSVTTSLDRVLTDRRGASWWSRRCFDLNLRRIILVCWIALSVAVAPIASTGASMHLGQGAARHKAGGHEQSASQPTAAADDAGDMADMSDCHKAMKTSGDCPCCDTKAKCPSDADCMTMCCKIVGAALSDTTRLALHPTVHGRPGEPEKPPEWVSKPPSPPPRT